MLKANFHIVRRLTAFLIAVYAAWALITVFALFIRHHLSDGRSLLWVFGESLRYFQAWTTSMVLLIAISAAVGRPAGSFLSRHFTISAVSSYVLFMIPLSPLYTAPLAPEFEIHLLGAFFLWWGIFSEHGGLSYRNAIKWLCVPAAYCMLTFVQGKMVAFIPYSHQGLFPGSSSFAESMLGIFLVLTAVFACAYIAGIATIFIDKAISRLKKVA